MRHAQLVAGIEPERLPATVELSLAGGHLGEAALAQLRAAALALPDVAEVDLEALAPATARATARLLRLGGLGLGLGLLGAAVLMAANLIGLVVHSQRDEIAILLLVGGTPGFIAAPYLLQGAMWGLLAAAGASAVLALLERQCAPLLQQAASALGGDFEVHLFEPRLILGLAAAGLLVGTVASFVAVQRFLRHDRAAAEDVF
ncbi:MAG: FtsX-like permease family protein [Acetobacteraceae bacterium]|nr:MAG: FtsX-like permease family protein [Acetobacteraceae bacterium]